MLVLAAWRYRVSLGTGALHGSNFLKLGTFGFGDKYM